MSDTGSPLAFVLVPGMLCDARVWAPVRALLPASSSVVDLDGAASLDAMADAILAEVAPRFVLAGFSMGGMAALLAAGRAPSRVASLAILSTHAETDTPARVAQRRDQIAAARGGRFTELASGLPSLYFADPAARPEDSALVLAMANAAGPAVFAGHVQAVLERPDLAAAARALRLPAHVVGGAEDRNATPDLVRRLGSLIPDARLTLIPGCGHMPPLETPGIVAGILDQLWRRTVA